MRGVIWAAASETRLEGHGQRDMWMGGGGMGNTCISDVPEAALRSLSHAISHSPEDFPADPAPGAAVSRHPEERSRERAARAAWRSRGGQVRLMGYHEGGDNGRREGKTAPASPDLGCHLKVTRSIFLPVVNFTDKGHLRLHG